MAAVVTGLLLLPAAVAVSRRLPPARLPRGRRRARRHTSRPTSRPRGAGFAATARGPHRARTARHGAGEGTRSPPFGSLRSRNGVGPPAGSRHQSIAEVRQAARCARTSLTSAELEKGLEPSTTCFDWWCFGLVWLYAVLAVPPGHFIRLRLVATRRLRTSPEQEDGQKDGERCGDHTRPDQREPPTHSGAREPGGGDGSRVAEGHRVATRSALDASPETGGCSAPGRRRPHRYEALHVLRAVACNALTCANRTNGVPSWRWFEPVWCHFGATASPRAPPPTRESRRPDSGAREPDGGAGSRLAAGHRAATRSGLDAAPQAGGCSAPGRRQCG